MEVLSYIDLPVHGGKPVAKLVEAFIAENQELVNSLEVVVRVSVCRAEGDKRTTKEQRLAQLAHFIKINPELPSIWKGGSYVFDFGERKFSRMDGRKKIELHLTAGEMVMLYQRLIRGHQIPNWTAFYANMRKRLGEDFLEGLV